MALIGSVSTSAYTCSDGTTRTVVLEWTATQNINNNTSEISWSLVGGGTRKGYVNVSELKVVIAGEEAYYRGTSTHTQCYPGTVLASGKKTISHNADGSKSITMSVSAGIYSWSINVTGSKTITLDTIPRASTITSANDITLGNYCKITWTPMSTSFKYTIKFSLGNWNYTTGFISPATTSSYTYDDYAISGTTTANNTTIYKQLPTSTSGTMTATLTTYNSSGTAIGSTSSKTFVVTIPSTVVPSIGTFTLDPENITTADGTSRNILIKGKNKLVASVSGCAAGNGSSIKSYTFSGKNLSSTISSTAASASATSNTISSVGSLTYTVKVTDARGRTASKESTITCYDYDIPTFSSFAAYRCNADGTINNNGTYVKYSFEVNYSSVNNTNKSTVSIYYKQNTSNTWSSAANAFTNSTTKTASAVIKNNNDAAISFDTDTTYIIRATVTDNYNSSTNSSTITIFGAARIFNIRSNGTGIAFGKMAEKDNLFESRWPLKVDDEIRFGDGTQGRLYTDETEGKNIVYIQTGQSINGGTTMGLAIHAGGQGSGTDVSSPSVYIENSANSGLVNLGSSGRKWNQLYAVNDTISTSDKTVKTDIVNMSDVQERLFNRLQPVTYKFINGSSNRTHYGFISQDVEDALNELNLTGRDFAGFCKDLRVDDNNNAILNENGQKIYDYSLRYSEFIALNTFMIQKLQAENAELKAELQELKEMIVGTSSKNVE